MKDANEIREATENIATTQECAMLMSLGIQDEFSSSSCEDDDDDHDHENRLTNCSTLKHIPTTAMLNTILVGSGFNWYELISHVLEVCGCDR